MTSSSYLHIKETELQVQKIINFQNVANNLLDTLTDYKGVTKSRNPKVNAPERMEIWKKTIQSPFVMKKGATITKNDNASNNCPRKEKTMHLQNTVNVSQHVVDRHLVNINMPQSSTQAHYMNESTNTSENSDTIILGNHEESNGMEEISINYTNSGEVYDHRTTIVNPNFSTVIVKNVLANPDPKTMAKC
jgi:hypothetical protein